MNHRFWSGLTAALLITAFGTTVSSYADSLQTADSGSQTNPSTTQLSQDPVLRKTKNTSKSVPPPSLTQQPLGVNGKDYRSPALIPTDQGTLTQVLSHELAGYQAATLYIRRIPFLTFLSSRPVTPNGSNLGDAAYGQYVSPGQGQTRQNQSLSSLSPSSSSNSTDDPVQRANVVAARLNPLLKNHVDANKIQLRWNPERASYSIRVKGKEVVELNRHTILANTTQNLAEDSIQATNLLRQLVGNAPPLGQTANKPKPQNGTEAGSSAAQTASQPVLLRLRGLASWYGPGFHGNHSASGEIFNQNAMTAAHRSLPFGTKARVTNLNNGRSVIVRINDRGPYVRNRIIDVSAAAARLLGMTKTGVAPVRIEVLDTRRTVAGY